MRLSAWELLLESIRRRCKLTAARQTASLGACTRLKGVGVGPTAEGTSASLSQRPLTVNPPNEVGQGERIKQIAYKKPLVDAAGIIGYPVIRQEGSHEQPAYCGD